MPANLNMFSVNGISEDRDGSLWLGSDHGMIRYDPVRSQVRNFRHDGNDPNTLCSDDIMAFYDDPSNPDKFLWVITYTCGLNKLDKLTGKVVHYSGSTDDPTSHAFDGMFDLYLDDNGMLWACTGFAGAVRYNLAESPFHHYKVRSFKNMP
jgi:ligand-binding sensor domain-containing protein